MSYPYPPPYQAPYSGGGVPFGYSPPPGPGTAIAAGVVALATSAFILIPAVDAFQATTAANLEDQVGALFWIYVIGGFVSPAFLIPGGILAWLRFRAGGVMLAIGGGLVAAIVLMLVIDAASAGGIEYIAALDWVALIGGIATLVLATIPPTTRWLKSRGGKPGHSGYQGYPGYPGYAGGYPGYPPQGSPQQGPPPGHGGYPLGPPGYPPQGPPGSY